MERLTYTWCVVVHVFSNGRSGGKLFRAEAKRFVDHVDNFITFYDCNKTAWRITPCPSKKDAVETAQKLNDMYRNNGTYYGR